MLCLPRNLHVKKQVKTLITMEERTGDHRRQPPTTQQPEPLTEHRGSHAVPAMEVHKVLRLPRNLHMELHKALRLPRNLHMEVHKVLRLPRNLHMEVHKVLCLPRYLRVKKQVKTVITMEERTGDHRRQPPTTQQQEPLTEHGDSHAVPAMEVHKVVRLPRNLHVISVCVVSVCVISVCVISVCVVSVCGLCTCCLGVEGG